MLLTWVVLWALFLRLDGVGGLTGGEGWWGTSCWAPAVARGVWCWVGLGGKDPGRSPPGAARRLWVLPGLEGCIYTGCVMGHRPRRHPGTKELSLCLGQGAGYRATLRALPNLAGRSLWASQVGAFAPLEGLCPGVLRLQDVLMGS